MGWASEMQIAELNARYESDAEFRREYDERMAMDAALAAEFFASEFEREKQINWFPERRLDFTGYEETDAPGERASLPIDDDLPF